jgi:peroxiredoxin Q/BCP
MLNEGSRAPDFSVLDDHGNKVSLKDFLDKKTVVLFFYPKANTPG